MLQGSFQDGNARIGTTYYVGRQGGGKELEKQRATFVYMNEGGCGGGGGTWSLEKYTRITEI